MQNQPESGIERLRLTDQERVAVLWAIASLETDPDPDGGQNKEAAGILKQMLDRNTLLGRTGSRQPAPKSL